MRKLLLGLCVFLASSTAWAQTADDLVGPGCIPAPCADILDEILAGVAVQTPIANADWLKWRNAADNANLDVLRVDSGDSVELNAITGEAIEFQVNKLNQWTISASGLVQDATANTPIIFTGATGSVSIRNDTSDGSDNKEILIAGGGAAGATRGGRIWVYGNEVPLLGGAVYLQGGDVASGDIVLKAGNNAGATVDFMVNNLKWSINNSGHLTSDATNGGDLIFGGSGDTISVQEATAATACMGAATPNGTTPVAVTTSCATTGSRVFYTRAGAVTNMGTISTTTAPSGTGFSFASTGASDTLANSVIYLIVKESA